MLHFKINKSCDNETEMKHIYIIMYICIVDSRKLRQSIAKKPVFIQSIVTELKMRFNVYIIETTR